MPEIREYKDLNELLCSAGPERFKEIVSSITKGAKDPLQDRLSIIEKMSDAEMKGDEDGVIRILKELYPLIARIPDAVQQDMLINRLHGKVKLLGIRKPSIQQSVHVMGKMLEDTDDGDNENEKNPQEEPCADFSGLVDIVIENGKPVFLLLDDNGSLFTAPNVQIEGKLFCPPEEVTKIWPILPRAEEVIKYFHNDDDSELYGDLIVYLLNNSELPDPRLYRLLALWVVHTYLMEKFHYSPYIWFFGDYSHGKSRTGKGLIYAAFRGVHWECLRDASIVRQADNWKASIFFDVQELWKKAESVGSDDVLMSRFERGILVPRVNNPEKGKHRDTSYYSIFGATVIATNHPIGRGMESRAVQITMKDSYKKFNNNVTWESALPLKERLLAFRARHMNTILPDVEKPALNRLGDITRPLLQVMRIVKPDEENSLLELIGDLEKERVKELSSTYEAEIIEALLHLKEDDKTEFVDGVECYVMNNITEKVNEGKLEKQHYSPQSIKNRLRVIGIEYYKKQTGTRRALYKFDEENLRLHCLRYGIEYTPKAPEGDTPDTSSPSFSSFSPIAAVQQESRRIPGRIDEASFSSFSHPSQNFPHGYEEKKDRKDVKLLPGESAPDTGEGIIPVTSFNESDDELPSEFPITDEYLQTLRGGAEN